MKKLVSVLLALVLLLSCVSALADQAFTSVTGTYTLQLPDGYIQFDSELLASIANGLTASQLSAALGVDETTAASLLSAFSSVDLSSTDIIYNGTYTGNLSVNVSEAGFTQETLVMLASTLDETLVSQYTAYGAAESDCHPQGMLTIGVHDFYAFYLDIWGITINQYMVITDGGNMLTFTFSNIEEADCLSILSTIQFTD